MTRQVKRGTAPGWLMLLALSPVILVSMVWLAAESGAPGGVLILFVFVGLVVWWSHWQADKTRGTNPQSTTARGVPIPKPSRTIPQGVKIVVSVRDGGKCRICGSTNDLQYDHIVPYSLGGRSDDPNNIQLLCRYHNRLKSNRYVG